MRDIKFRAWDDNDGVYRFAGKIGFDGGVESDWGADKEWTLEQYTGLRDKSGRDIYEGDICRAWIDFGPGGEGQRIVTVEITPHGTAGLEPWTFREDGYLPEIIGNIHDNPDLLEGTPHV